VDTIGVCAVAGATLGKGEFLNSLLDNLAYACAVCNFAKGTDIATVLEDYQQPVRLFNPRTDEWDEHFRLQGATILPLTPIGEATIKVLNLNDPARILERQALIRIGRYP
jgi:hypothetical protein